MSRQVTLSRWIALVATDTITVSIPEGVDPEGEHFHPYDWPAIHETREVIDSTDSGEWEVQP